MPNRHKAALNRARRTALLLALLAPLLVAAGDTEITYVENGLSAANRWVAKHPADIAVVVRHGAQSSVDPATIEYWLDRDFAERGCKAHFIFERGSQGSAIGFVTRNHGWGPFSLADSRKNVAETCAQHRFEIERGLN